eukprot:5143697-Amphidinium_carterae.3
MDEYEPYTIGEVVVLMGNLNNDGRSGPLTCAARSAGLCAAGRGRSEALDQGVVVHGRGL